MDVPQIKIYQPSEPRPSYTAIVTAGTSASIGTGVPTFRYDATAASWTGAVRVGTDGEGTSSQAFAGISKSTSNEIASAAGTVVVWLPLPGMIYVGAAKTSTNANTAALVNGLIGKRVVFDLTSTVWSVDTGASDAATNALVIIGGDYNNSLIYFTVKPTCTTLGQIA